jgi:uncharacterized membrane protein YgdD (TMEM256/DUF423 family)
MIDTSTTLQIEKSPAQLAVGLGLCALFLLGCLWMVTADVSGGGRRSELVAPIGWVGLVVFGAFGALLLKQMFSGTGPVLSFTPTGLTDKRISVDEMPWAEVDALSTWSMQNQPAMIVKLNPETEAAMTLGRIASMTRGANTKLGADGLAVTAKGTKINHDDLIATTMTYLAAHNPNFDQSV